MHSMVTAINNCILYLKVVKRVDFKCYHNTHTIIIM